MICRSLPTCVPCLPPVGMSCQTDGVFLILSSKARSLYMLQGQKKNLSLLFILAREKGCKSLCGWAKEACLNPSWFCTVAVMLVCGLYFENWLDCSLLYQEQYSYFSNLYHKMSMTSEICCSYKTTRLWKIISKLTIYLQTTIYLFSSVYFWGIFFWIICHIENEQNSI